MDDTEQALSLDTFLISIHSPHLYIQSTAVEKGDCVIFSLCDRGLLCCTLKIYKAVKNPVDSRVFIETSVCLTSLCTTIKIVVTS